MATLYQLVTGSGKQQAVLDEIVQVSALNLEFKFGSRLNYHVT